MSTDKLDEIARRVARWALREPALEAEVAVIRAAIDEAVAERDREWREALGVAEKDCPAFAQTWLRSSVSEAVVEERRALLEIVEVEGMDSQAKVRILAALTAREAKRPEQLLPRDWKHTEKCLVGVSNDKCICWPPVAAREEKP